MIVKTAKWIAAKWARVTAERTVDYEEGVRKPSKDWEKETTDAEGRYEEGIKASIARKAFGKGVRRVGTAKQKSATILKGIARWPEGVRVAEPDMEKGMQPVVSVLEALELPKRYPTGDPRNIDRVKAIAAALHKMKTG